ncbi:hypothetical protein SAMN05443429_10834 [Cruoricaptor ignavus]|uniref:PIN domain-containing protein n=1 Tax=Cruoricaptor ignavus TaxID=1118202 RepID=A0A1M6G2X2_9FLAO|nr:PIN domain protein [Cruoricaptor ignavus]SHJ04315.1 hypothetical protein SAMN05443429_10834 [Cruoricaptor ignavus]
MQKQRIYIDTSVVGGYFDEEFKIPTEAFFERVFQREIVLIVSDLLVSELQPAPERVRNFFDNFENDFFEKVRVNQEVKALALKYLEANVVGRTSLADCEHIAMATISGADALVSWNFKHIVNLNRIRGYNGINYQLGYKMIEIRSPKELLHYG